MNVCEWVTDLFLIELTSVFLLLSSRRTTDVWRYITCICTIHTLTRYIVFVALNVGCYKVENGLKVQPFMFGKLQWFCILHVDVTRQMSTSFAKRDPHTFVCNDDMTMRGLFADKTFAPNYLLHVHVAFVHSIQWTYSWITLTAKSKVILFTVFWLEILFFPYISYCCCYPCIQTFL